MIQTYPVSSATRTSISESEEEDWNSLNSPRISSILNSSDVLELEALPEDQVVDRPESGLHVLSSSKTREQLEKDKIVVETPDEMKKQTSESTLAPLDIADHKGKNKRLSLFNFQIPNLFDFNRSATTESKNDTDLEVGELKGRKSEETVRKSTKPLSTEPDKFRSRSMSFSLGVTKKKQLDTKMNGTSVNGMNEWNFANYSFSVDPNAREIKRPDILDVPDF